MSSKKGSRRELFQENSHYKAFLGSIQERVNELWESTLCHGPALNTNELLKEHMMLREFLYEVENLQKTASGISKNLDSSCSDEREASLVEFLDWAKAVGINHRSVKIARAEDFDGFGLQTTDYVSIGSDLLQVPRKAILSWDNARKSAFLKRAFDRDLIVRSMENVALALMLCCQKLVSGSNWQSYIKVLPENFNTPLFFTIEQLQCLRPSPIFEESLLLYRNVSRQFIHFLMEIIRSDIFRHKKKKSKVEMSEMEPIYVNSPLTAANFTFSLYRWSVACISTRINMIPSEVIKGEMGQPRMIPALIPFLDMVNHKYTDDAFHEAVHFSDETDSAEIIAIRDYKPCEPIYIFYGWRSNREFLLHNGFVPMEKNIRDVYKLKIGLPKSKREEARWDLFRSLGFTIESNIFAFEVKVFEPYFHESLIHFAQIYVLDEVTSTEQTKETINTPENIRKAWNFLRDRFALLRRAYGKAANPPSDMQLSTTSSENRTSDIVRKSMIVRLQLSEMEILYKAEDFCNKQLKSDVALATITSMIN